MQIQECSPDAYSVSIQLQGIDERFSIRCSMHAWFHFVSFSVMEIPLPGVYGSVPTHCKVHGLGCQASQAVLKIGPSCKLPQYCQAGQVG